MSQGFTPQVLKSMSFLRRTCEGMESMPSKTVKTMFFALPTIDSILPHLPAWE